MHPAKARVDVDVEKEVNSAERTERQWSELMTHEVGFTGAAAFSHQHAPHSVIRKLFDTVLIFYLFICIDYFIETSSF